MTINQTMLEGYSKFLGILKISLCGDRRFEGTQNLKCEDGRLQNCVVLTEVETEDMATKIGNNWGEIGD